MCLLSLLVWQSFKDLVASCLFLLLCFWVVAFAAVFLILLVFPFVFSAVGWFLLMLLLFLFLFEPFLLLSFFCLGSEGTFFCFSLFCVAVPRSCCAYLSPVYYPFFQGCLILSWKIFRKRSSLESPSSPPIALSFGLFRGRSRKGPTSPTLFPVTAW